ncbi:MAG: hypothetical protein IT258_00645 [Saprospiraceae bacterium]|nr:hypothetical protein [Saprospiraceae bacterium]
MHFILFLISTLPFSQDAWTEQTNQAGRFRILLPGNFTEKIDSVKTEVGPLVYHTFFLQNNDQGAENLFYMVSYCDYPASVVFADSVGLAEEIFTATIESATEAVKGALVYSSDIQMDKYPGKQWRIDYMEGKVVIKNRAYLVGNRFYSLQTIAYKEKSLNADGTKFFDSFRLL